MQGPRRRVWIGLWILAAMAWLPSYAAQETYRHANVERVVAIGDSHGAYKEFTGLLRQTGLVDGSLAWSGGETHLVSLGDFLDRGADSRKIMDLLMGLQAQAAAAGGKVHVVVGNHELMNLTGDLRYVSEAEYAAFAAEEDEAERNAARAAYAALPPEAQSKTFEQRYPAGFFAHRRAFSPSGRYGTWLRAQPFMVVVNDSVFVHGGLPPLLEGASLDQANQQLSAMLSRYDASWDSFARNQGLLLPVDFFDRLGLARSLPDAVGAQLVEATRAPLFSPDGPLWNRENALCIPATIEDTVDRVLKAFEARRVVVGHTVTFNNKISTRLDGRVVMTDTGMLTSHYKGGVPSALVIHDGDLRAAYLGQPGEQELAAVPRMVGKRPGGMSDDELENWLATAEVVSIEDVGEGVTKPRKVRLEKDGVSLKAVFKTVDLREQRRRGKVSALADRYRFEIAAYRVDRLLGLGLVPVTIERRIDGRTGSLQFWVEGLVNQIQILEENMSMDGWCPIEPQMELLKVFDALIYNQDRTQQNLTFIRDDWQLVAIDHSRSFESTRSIPDLVARSAYLVVRPAMAERLKALDKASLERELGESLGAAKIKALLVRRDLLLKKYVGRETRDDPLD